MRVHVTSAFRDKLKKYFTLTLTQKTGGKQISSPL